MTDLFYLFAHYVTTLLVFTIPPQTLESRKNRASSDSAIQTLDHREKLKPSLSLLVKALA